MSDRRAVQLSEAQARAMGLLPPEHTPLETPTAEPVGIPAAPATSAPVPDARPRGVSKPRMPAPSLVKPTAPPTRAYSIIDAALRLSGAINGAPVVQEDARQGVTVITLLPRLRLLYTTRELAATTFVHQVQDSRGWHTIASERLPMPTPTEKARLLVWYWLGETSWKEE